MEPTKMRPNIISTTLWNQHIIYSHQRWGMKQRPSYPAPVESSWRVEVPSSTRLLVGSTATLSKVRRRIQRPFFGPRRNSWLRNVKSLFNMPQIISNRLEGGYSIHWDLFFKSSTNFCNPFKTCNIYINHDYGGVFMTDDQASWKSATSRPSRA